MLLPSKLLFGDNKHCAELRGFLEQDWYTGHEDIKNWYLTSSVMSLVFQILKRRM